VLMAREAGAKKVYFTSCAPPITNAHIYGIDLASSSELVAHDRDSAAIAKHIGADDVVFQTLEDLESACARLSPRDPKTQKFEVGVFCGKYVTPVEDGYFEHLERIRGETRKVKVMEKAREAVMHGVADSKQIRIASKGAVSDSDMLLIYHILTQHRWLTNMVTSFHLTRAPSRRRMASAKSLQPTKPWPTVIATRKGPRKAKTSACTTSTTSTTDGVFEIASRSFWVSSWVGGRIGLV
jgi:hypothetical protein